MTKKILVVDDQNMIRAIASRVLTRENFNVVTAENGQEGLDVLITEKPDLVLCDHDMPVMNGYEFCKTVHIDPKFSELRIIPIIGIGSFPDDKREYLKECNEKPFAPRDLIDMVKRYI